MSSAVWVAMTSGAALPESASLTWNGLAWRLPVLVRKKHINTSQTPTISFPSIIHYTSLYVRLHSIPERMMLLIKLKYLNLILKADC